MTGSLADFGVTYREVLVKHWSNTCQKLVKCGMAGSLADFGVTYREVLVKHYSNTGQTLVKHWSNAVERQPAGRMGYVWSLASI